MTTRKDIEAAILRYLQASGPVVAAVNRKELANALAGTCVHVLAQAPKVITCVYCGHNYPSNTPTHNHELLTTHIKTCVQHPMRAVEQELEAAKQLLLELQQAVVAFDDSVTSIQIFKDHRKMDFQQAQYVALMAKIPCRAKVIRDTKDYAVVSRYSIPPFDTLELPHSQAACVFRRRSVKATVIASQAAAKKERRYGPGPAKKAKRRAR